MVYKLPNWKWNVLTNANFKYNKEYTLFFSKNLIAELFTGDEHKQYINQLKEAAS